MKLHITRLLAVLSACVALMVLMAWVFDIHVFKSVLPGVINMKFNTALGFLFISAAIWMLEDTRRPSCQRWATIIAWIVIVFGLLSASQTLFGFNAGIDEFFWKDDPNPIATNYPGRPSVQTSFSFVTFGIIVLLSRFKKMVIVNLVLLVAILSLAMLVFLNQLFGSSFLQAIPWLAHTALITAVLFILVSFAFIKSRHFNAFQLNFEQRIALYFGVALLHLVFIFFAIADNNKQRADSRIGIKHSYDTQLMSERISKMTAEIQSSVRGFFVTKDEYYVAIFDSLTVSMTRELKQFKKLSLNYGEQDKWIDSLSILIDEYITSRKEMIAMQMSGTLNPGMFAKATNDGLVRGNQLRSLISNIQQYENDLLEKREERNNTTIQNSNRIILIFQILTLVLIISTFFVIQRKNKERNAAEQKLKKSEAELRKSMENFAFALESSGIGSWTIDLIQGEIKRSALHDKIMGYDEPVAEWSFDIFFNKHAVKEDHEKVKAAWDAAAKGNNSLEFECRIIKADGTLGWIWCKSRIFYNDDGKPAFLMGFVGDETAAKSAEQEIRMLNATLEKRVAEKTTEVLEKETHYRSLLENMQEGIQIMSPEFRYLFLNKTALNQSHYTEAELLGYTMMEKYPGIEGTELYKQLRICLAQQTSTVLINEFEFPDGSKGWFELSIQPVPEGVLILSTDISDQKRLEKELISHQIQQQKLAIQLALEAQEKERNELARELHDNINQILAAAKLYLARAKKQESSTQHLVQQGFEYVSMAVDEIRKLSHTLVTPSLGDTDLVDALQGLSRQFAIVNGLEITIHNQLPDHIQMDVQKELMLYRIAQEQVSNINKHANASKISIALGLANNQLCMTIADNGIGFDTSQKPAGIGLRNISTRLQFYGGNMRIVSAPNEGCRLEISVPA